MGFLNLCKISTEAGFSIIFKQLLIFGQKRYLCKWLRDGSGIKTEDGVCCTR